MSRLIKKYKNRRLYDTEISAYITLDEIGHYVTEGVDFKIIDAASGKDISSPVLLQLLVEMESGATQFLSPLVLKQMVLMARHPMHKAMTSALEQMLMSLTDNVNQTAAFQHAGTVWSEQLSEIMQQWQGIFDNKVK